MTDDSNRLQFAEEYQRRQLAAREHDARVRRACLPEAIMRSELGMSAKLVAITLWTEAGCESRSEVIVYKQWLAARLGRTARAIEQAVAPLFACGWLELIETIRGGWRVRIVHPDDVPALKVVTGPETPLPLFGCAVADPRPLNDSPIPVDNLLLGACSPEFEPAEAAQEPPKSGGSCAGTAEKAQEPPKSGGSCAGTAAGTAEKAQEPRILKMGGEGIEGVPPQGLNGGVGPPGQPAVPAPYSNSHSSTDTETVTVARERDGKRDGDGRPATGTETGTAAGCADDGHGNGDGDRGGGPAVSVSFSVPVDRHQDPLCGLAHYDPLVVEAALAIQKKINFLDRVKPGDRGLDLAVAKRAVYLIVDDVRDRTAVFDLVDWANDKHGHKPVRQLFTGALKKWYREEGLTW